MGRSQTQGEEHMTKHFAGTSVLARVVGEIEKKLGGKAQGAEKQESVACNIQMDECSSQPEQAPRCMTCGKWTDKHCRNTTPQQRKPLTDETRNWIVATCPTPRHIIDAVERMHGITGDQE
jgi:hypothetical protein